MTRLAQLAFVASLSTLSVAGAFAQAPAAKPEGAKFAVAEGMQANLAKHVGEKVELILSSGKSVSGTLKDVGGASCHVTALEGKEFYDALVRLDQVSAVVVRAK